MTHPIIENTPGLIWRPRMIGWEARWQARTDLIKRGFTPKSVHLWTGVEPSKLDCAYISDRCNFLQSEMLLFGHGGVPKVSHTFDGTVASLAKSYQEDADSPYQKLRYKSRVHYDDLIRRLIKDSGTASLAEMKGRSILHLHNGWTGGTKIAMGHSMVGMLRTLFSFGASILEDAECKRLAAVLHEMRFEMAKPRTETLTAEHANAIRTVAHRMGLHSIALAQAFQFDCMLRQKDVIGEWVPTGEPGLTDVTWGNSKWLMGIRWSEIDANLVLRHITSKRGKLVEHPLSNAPMVMEELARIGKRPETGPVIVQDSTGLPYINHQFRRVWRDVANEAGVPKSVKNMDTRAGAITEATMAGVALESIKHAAAHSDIAITQRYARDGATKSADVMQKRADFRKNKP
jgi:hypothetical protein